MDTLKNEEKLLGWDVPPYSTIAVCRGHNKLQGTKENSPGAGIALDCHKKHYTGLSASTSATGLLGVGT